MRSLNRFAPALATLLTSAVLVTACTDAPDDEDADPAGPTTASVEADEKADATELRVRAGSMTVWIDRTIEVHASGDTLYAVIKGRASRNLTGAFSFVPDDAFGDAVVTGPRSFEIELPGGHILNSLMSGLPLFVDLDVASGTEPDYAVKIDLRAGFTRFTGSSSLMVDALTRPIFIGLDSGEALRYQAIVRTSNPAPVTVTNAGTPEIYPTTGGYAVDFRYAALASAWAAGGRVTFRQGTAQKTATLGVRTTAVAMTTLDAYDAWPTPSCELDVYNCMTEFRGVDLATCGDYRELQRCAYVDICELTTAAPLILSPLDLGFVWSGAAADYRTGCTGGGQWCSLGDVATFMLPECLAETPTLEQIVANAAAQTDDQDFAAGPFAAGQVLDRAGVQGTSFFSAAYSPGGPALFDALDAHFARGEVQGWLYREEVACHNCTDFRDKLILWWPAAFRVVVLEGGHGYDS